MIRRQVLVWCAACLLMGGAWAQDEIPAPIVPDIPSAQMTLSWQDFMKLMEIVKSPKMEAAPLPYAVTQARYTVELADEDSVQVNVDLNVSVWTQDSKWVSAPVLSGALAPTSANVGGPESNGLAAQGEWLCLVTKQPGNYNVNATFFLPLERAEGRESFSFACPQAPTTNMSLRLPMPEAVLSAPAAGHIRANRGDNMLQAEIAFKTTDRIEVSWTRPEGEATPEQPVQEEARVACTTSTMATAMGDRYLACSTQVQFDVLRGSVDAFKFSLPPSARVSNVNSPDAAITTTDTEAGQVIEVRGNRRWSDGHMVILQYETLPEQRETALCVPKLTIEGIVRETGYIGVAAQGAVAVNVAEGAANLTRIDSVELPGNLRGMSPTPILFAFRHNGGDYACLLDVKKLTDAEVRIASIDSANLQTLLTREGTIVTQAMYLVRNNVKQFLRVDLGEGAKIWSAAVNGQVVKPAYEDGTTALLIPLSKSTEQGQQLDTFPVEIIYEMPAVKMPGLMGDIPLTAPPTDILVNQLDWQIYTPDNQFVYRCTGDVHKRETGSRWPMPVFGDFFGRRAGREAAARPHAAFSAPDMKLDSRGISVERLSELSNKSAGMLAQVQTMVNDSKQMPQPSAPGMMGGGMGGISNVAVAAGVLPVRATVPFAGNSSSYERLIVPENTVIHAVLHTYNSRINWVFYGLGYLLAAMAGYAVMRWIRRTMRAQHAGKWSSFLMAILILIVALCCLYVFPAFISLESAVIVGIIIAAMRKLPSPAPTVESAVAPALEG